MRGFAAVIMVLGVMLMSAPLVLPRLGITLTPVSAAAPASLPALGGMDIDRMTGLGTAVSGGMASIGALLGGGAPPAAGPGGMPVTEAEVAAQFDAVCTALAQSGQVSGADCDSAALAKPGAGGSDPTAAMGAAAAGTAAAATILEIDRRTPRKSAGAKFVKVQE